MLKGLGISSGIAIGQAFLWQKKQIIIEKVKTQNPQSEFSKFQNALQQSQTSAFALIEKAKKELGKDEVAVFESHLMILQDPELHLSVEIKILKEFKIAPWAVEEAFDEYIQIFSQMNDYMKGRTTDLLDLRDSILSFISENPKETTAINNKPFILVTNDLAPSDSLKFELKNILGFATDDGGATTHTAIIARSKGIPAVAGLKNITQKIKNGDVIALNGDTGEIFINPAAEILADFEKQKNKFEKEKEIAQRFINQPTIMKDGTRMTLSANVGNAESIKLAVQNGAEGIGLFRTEFLFMERSQAPSEEEQFQAYKKALEAMKGKKTVIRTLDVGGDKEISYLGIPKEFNPFMGNRAIRYCLQNPEIFKTQLNALLRASVFGNLWIMIPMITCLEEILETKKLLAECKSELQAQGISMSENIKFGIMIEVPSAAIISDVLAQHVDFFSIGTNDLIQYTCAADRMNEAVSHLYNAHNPAIFRLIKLVADNAKKNSIPVSVCGELAAVKDMQAQLIGLGITDLSMTPLQIPFSRARIADW